MPRPIADSYNELLIFKRSKSRSRRKSETPAKRWRSRLTSDTLQANKGKEEEEENEDRPLPLHVTEPMQRQDYIPNLVITERGNDVRPYAPKQNIVSVIFFSG